MRPRLSSVSASTRAVRPARLRVNESVVHLFVAANDDVRAEVGSGERSWESGDRSWESGEKPAPVLRSRWRRAHASSARVDISPELPVTFLAMCDFDSSAAGSSASAGRRSRPGSSRGPLLGPKRNASPLRRKIMRVTEEKGRNGRPAVQKAIQEGYAIRQSSSHEIMLETPENK